MNACCLAMLLGQVFRLYKINFGVWIYFWSEVPCLLWLEYGRTRKRYDERGFGSENRAKPEKYLGLPMMVHRQEMGAF
ncbi:hypothetical protein EPI10_000728 [Gossypium australe]|uniref:Uncharacterized protein n=1 Tax=Gossypium australe TaxID=47621 RepID=A0A5B6V913_9ROSI|nr:hypothetical protein EPI10_000728 [Gossypium australe]